MTDASPSTAENAPQPALRVLAQYVRDFSFENPRAPESLRVEGKPDIDMGVEMNARGRNDGLFEVELKLSIKAATADMPMFAAELVYGGVFALNVPEEALEQTLLIECPRFLFPFARRIIADATADGGFFPPFLLEPIDFAAVYAAQKNGQLAQPVGQA